MKKFKVWIVVRDAATLERVAEASVFGHDDRLCCERFAEVTNPAAEAPRLQLFGPHITQINPLYQIEVRATGEVAPAAPAHGVDDLLEELRALAERWSDQRRAEAAIRGSRLFARAQALPMNGGFEAVGHAFRNAMTENLPRRASMTCDCLQPYIDPALHRCSKCGKPA